MPKSKIRKFAATAISVAAIGCSSGSPSGPEDDMPVCKPGERTITHDCWEQPGVNPIEPDTTIVPSDSVTVVDWPDGSSSSKKQSSSSIKPSSSSVKQSSSSVTPSSSSVKQSSSSITPSSSSSEVLYSSSSSSLTYEPSSSSYKLSSSSINCDGQGEINPCAIKNPENGSPKGPEIQTPGVNPL